MQFYTWPFPSTSNLEQADMHVRLNAALHLAASSDPASAEISYEIRLECKHNSEISPTGSRCSDARRRYRHLFFALLLHAFWSVYYIDYTRIISYGLFVTRR